MFHRNLVVAVLVGANELDPLVFAILFATDETGSSILAVFVDRRGLDLQALVGYRIRRFLRVNAGAAED